MKRRWLATAALLLMAASLRAVEFATVHEAGHTLTVCRVDVRREKLELFWRDAAGLPLNRLSRVAELVAGRGQRLVFAMNAGMFRPGFAPLGLYVAAEREEAPLNLRNDEGNFFLKPNGVFYVTARGAHVIESSEYPAVAEKVLLATQSGPLLVHRGELHPKFLADSPSRLYRSGVCAPTPETAIFVTSEDPLNFHEFATYFRDRLHAREALFLDGTLNSLYAPALQRNDFRAPLGPMIGVVEAAPPPASAGAPAP